MKIYGLSAEQGRKEGREEGILCLFFNTFVGDKGNLHLRFGWGCNSRRAPLCGCGGQGECIILRPVMKNLLAVCFITFLLFLQSRLAAAFLVSAASQAFSAGQAPGLLLLLQLVFSLFFWVFVFQSYTVGSTIVLIDLFVKPVVRR